MPRKKKSSITFETVAKIALALPGVEISTSYGTPALKVKGKLFVRMWEDGSTMVLKSTFDQREELMEADPKTYFITEHYNNYEWVLVNLNRVKDDALSDLLNGAYRLATAKRK